MTVADRERVTDRDDGDRRQRRALVLCQPDPLPAGPGDRGRPEVAVELLGAARLERAVDRVDGDLHDLTARGMTAGAQAALVDHVQAARPAGQRGPAAATGGAVERALRVDLRGTGQQHGSMMLLRRPPYIGHSRTPEAMHHLAPSGDPLQWLGVSDSPVQRFLTDK